jgi:hypothetical protein
MNGIEGDDERDEEEEDDDSDREDEEAEKEKSPNRTHHHNNQLDPSQLSLLEFNHSIQICNVSEANPDEWNRRG